MRGREMRWRRRVGCGLYEWLTRPAVLRFRTADILLERMYGCLGESLPVDESKYLGRGANTALLLLVFMGLAWAWFDHASLATPSAFVRGLRRRTGIHK